MEKKFWQALIWLKRLSNPRRFRIPKQGINPIVKKYYDIQEQQNKEYAWYQERVERGTEYKRSWLSKRLEKMGVKNG